MSGRDQPAKKNSKLGFLDEISDFNSNQPKSGQGQMKIGVEEMTPISRTGRSPTGTMTSNPSFKQPSPSEREDVFLSRTDSRGSGKTTGRFQDVPATLVESSTGSPGTNIKTQTSTNRGYTFSGSQPPFDSNARGSGQLTQSKVTAGFGEDFMDEGEPGDDFFDPENNHPQDMEIHDLDHSDLDLHGMLHDDIDTAVVLHKDENEDDDHDLDKAVVGHSEEEEEEMQEEEVSGGINELVANVIKTAGAAGSASISKSQSRGAGVSSGSGALKSEKTQTNVRGTQSRSSENEDEEIVRTRIKMTTEEVEDNSKEVVENQAQTRAYASGSTTIEKGRSTAGAAATSSNSKTNVQGRGSQKTSGRYDQEYVKTGEETEEVIEEESGVRATDGDGKAIYQTSKNSKIVTSSTVNNAQAKSSPLNAQFKEKTAVFTGSKQPFVVNVSSAAGDNMNQITTSKTKVNIVGGNVATATAGLFSPPSSMGKPPRNISSSMVLDSTTLAEVQSPHRGRPPRNPTENKRRTSLYHSTRFDSTGELKDLHEVNSNESVDGNLDEAESGIEMKTLKFLFRIDNVVIRNQSKHVVELFNRISQTAKNLIENRQRHLQRVQALSKMQFLQRFRERMRLYPRRAFLKWKIHSDELFVASKLPKIALVGRLNYMIAMFRFMYMINLQRTKKQVSLRKVSKGIKELIHLQERLEVRKNDKHANMLHAFSKLKNKYHRTIKIEIFANTIESLSTRRHFKEAFFSNLCEKRRQTRSALHNLLRTQNSKLSSAFSSLCLHTQYTSESTDSHPDIPSTLELYSSIQSLRRSVSSTLQSVFSHPQSVQKGLIRLYATMDSAQRKIMRKPFVWARGVQGKRLRGGVCALARVVDRIVSSRMRTAFRSLLSKRLQAEQKKVARVIIRLVRHQQEKVREAVQNMMYVVDTVVEEVKKTEVDESTFIAAMSNICRLERNRKRLFFNCCQSLIAELKMQSYMVSLFAWSRSTKAAKFENALNRKSKTFEAFLGLQSFMRRKLSGGLKLALLRIRNESFLVQHFKNPKRLSQEFNTWTFEPLRLKRLRVGFEAIKRKFYKVTVHRMKMEKVISRIETTDLTDVDAEVVGAIVKVSKVVVRKVGSNRNVQIGY